MDPDPAWAIIAAQRIALADLLDSLTDAEWDTPSLCTAWRVRDVAAHVASVTQPPPTATLLRELIKARGSYHGLIRNATIDIAERIGTDSARMLRENATSRILPGPTNYKNILFDTLIHAQDIARPLGREMPMDRSGAVDGAERVWRVGLLFGSRRRFRGVRFEATDADLTLGDGAPARGPIADILLVLTGRPAGLDALTGPGAVQARRALTA